MAPSNGNAWKLEQASAQLTFAGLRAQVLPGRTAEGIGNLVWQGAKLDPRFRLLQAAGESDPPAVQEVYQRGRDLVASYAPAEKGAAQSQLYWRAMRPLGPAHAAVGVELIVSRQTSSLDAEASVRLHTTWPFPVDLLAWQGSDFEALPGSRVFEQPPLVLLGRLEGHALSYAEMVHPTDLYRIRCGADRSGWETELFPQHLEKGVIRRGRVWSVFLPREADCAASIACYEAFAASPPPLTA
jgi:hypothetical protein